MTAVRLQQGLAPPPVPQTDPRAGYHAQRTEIDAAIADVLDGGRYVLGERVDAFERAFAGYLGVAHAVGVANNTDALALALRALGVGPGDRVAVVSHTAVATLVGIGMTGASQVFVDIDPDNAGRVAIADRYDALLAASAGLLTGLSRPARFGAAAPVFHRSWCVSPIGTRCAIGSLAPASVPRSIKRCRPTGCRCTPAPRSDPEACRIPNGWSARS